MNDETVAQFAEIILSVAQANAATIDMLSLICLHLAEEETDSVQRLRETLKNLSDNKQFETTDAFVSLAGRCLSFLAGHLDTPFLSLKKSLPSPSNPEELRARLHVIQGGKS